MTRIICIVAFLSSFTPRVGAAQDDTPSTTAGGTDEGAAPADKEVFTPPAIVEYVTAQYPEAAKEKGLEADVTAELSVDENGLVVGVEILKPAGNGFDEAAEDALYQFVFSPATKGGVPVPSRIRYVYKFFLRAAGPEDEAETEAPLPAELRGRITDIDGNPIPGVAVVLTDMSPADAEASVESPPQIVANSRGAFVAKALRAGSYQIDLIAPGFKPLSASEELEAGEIREVVYRLENEKALYETVVRARRPQREVTRREITRKEITRIPGTGGDALRSVQNMPGMARAAFGGGDLIVRGSSPEDSGYYFDSMLVPLLYHFFGITSIINSDLLESIDFFPGNYSVRYNGATGGIVEVYPKVPETDRFHAYIDANLFHASLLLETPLNKDWSIAASGRRSYIDAIANAVMPQSDGFAFTVAPRYYDYQLVADYHPADGKNKLNLFFFGSDDKMVFLFGNDVVGDPSFTGGVNMHILFHQFQARYTRQISKELKNTVQLGTRYEMRDMGVGGLFDIQYDVVPVYLRDELAYDAKRNIAYRLGIDSDVIWTQWKVRAPASGWGVEGENQDPISANEELAETSGDVVTFKPGWYGELELRPVDGLKLVGGVRFDYWHDLKEFSIGPRLVARYQLFAKTALKGGIGLFHQLPTAEKYDKEFGNPDLGLINGTHYTLGVEQDITDVIHIGVEGFYKQLRNLVVRDDTTRYSNAGKGKAYGLEFLLKHDETDRFFGWISYTLMRSKRIDHPGEKARLFDYDQTHILTVVGSLTLGRGWEAGVRFRLVSGNPDTPIEGSMFDADSDNYWPVYGNTNSNRLPLFHQLDVRVDKNWTWKYLKLAVYIDVMNVYNHKNPEGYMYNYDFSQRQYFNGLPVLPILGLKLEH